MGRNWWDSSVAGALRLLRRLCAASVPPLCRLCATSVFHTVS